ncbi:hypothetical protein ACP26L_36350 (plasmid) [Paenibacillus sp. S-38]|uniref:hypothetical protein n=1 Tax=Paenibacillus sp. S-38 TaxID=3416710 RepID=UPI003CF91048
MIRWADVTENDWFFSEVMEAANYLLEDGEPMVTGIPYAVFEQDAPYLYEEKEGIEGQKIFTLSKKIAPTEGNPLFVYLDGAQTVHKSISTNAAGTTDVELYVAPRAGATVSFIFQGKAKVDRFGRPESPTDYSGFGYPAHPLDSGSSYVFDPFNRNYQEYCYAFGRPLQRINVDEAEWNVSVHQAIAEKYIGYHTDVYVVSPAPNATIYLPYNLSGVTCRFNYVVFQNGYYQLKGGNFKATSQKVWRTDRFFPEGYINRAEAFSLIDRMRKTIYGRFSDIDAPGAEIDQYIVAEEGQRRFRLNGTYPAGQGQLVVRRNGVFLQHNVDYKETDNHTVTFYQPQEKGVSIHFGYEKKQSTRFVDVGAPSAMYIPTTDETIQVEGEGAWWADAVLALEGETFENGEYLINGYDIGRFKDGAVIVDSMYTPLDGGTNLDKIPHFMAKTLLTRAQAVAFLNRFRKWVIERFK